MKSVVWPLSGLALGAAMLVAVVGCRDDSRFPTSSYQPTEPELATATAATSLVFR